MTREKRLAAALKKGDTVALEKLMRGYTGYVCTVISNFSRGMLSLEDIDDLTQDVFVKLWEARGSLDEEYGIRSYLSAIARNAVKNCLRSLKPAAEDITELELSSGESVERQAELTDTLRCLDECLKELSDEDSGIFMRFYFYGEKTSEIAKITRLSESTVRSKLCRARQKLKRLMTERGFENV